MSTAIVERQKGKTDIEDEIDALLSECENLDNNDIYARYNFVSRLLALTQRQTAESVDRYAELSKNYKELADKYVELAKQYDGVPQLLFTSFSLDPTSTLEFLLKDVERLMKVEDQSGDAWKWGLKLTFKHRLKIAWRLIFRPVVNDTELVTDEK